ncbi:MAG: hypothetical protein RL404_1259, partial [Pseudomonadota bacterium]
MLNIASATRHALFMLLACLLVGGWPALAGAVQVDAGTPIIFTDKGARVLEDRDGSLTAEGALERERQFSPAASVGAPRAGSHY